MISQAHRAARRRVHGAVAKQRERALSRIRAAQTELQTRRRMYQQRVSFALLRAAWKRLEAELLRRWRTPELRKAWMEGAVQQGLQQLGPGEWLVTCPASWSESEQQDLKESLSGRLDQAPRIEPDAEVQGGLRIASAGISLDATIQGLLADRTSLEARLLALLAEDETA